MPGRVSRLASPGFGNEKPSTYAKSAGDWTGQLNEVVNSSVRRSCVPAMLLWVFEQTSAACWGDSGSGAVEPGSRSIVVGIFSEGESPCRPGETHDAFLASRAALCSVHASMRSSYIDGISDGSADAPSVIRPLPAIGIVCAILGALGVWRIRQRHERRTRLTDDGGPWAETAGTGEPAILQVLRRSSSFVVPEALEPRVSGTWSLLLSLRALAAWSPRRNGSDSQQTRSWAAGPRAKAADRAIELRLDPTMRRSLARPIGAL